MKLLYFLTMLAILPSGLFGADYHVGPGETYTNIGDAPWATLVAGDRVFIHWRSTPYYEKWVINRQGTAAEPIEVIGISGPAGEKPIISGENAITATGLNYWGENTGVIKIGGSNTPADDMPSYITIENLEVRSGRPAYSFTNDASATETYASNCASIYIEKGQHITISNCDIHDSGNGIFVGAFDGETQDILITGNYIYDNGIVGSFYEHNTYTAALGITYEYNRFGPLRSGADGNNLKDRSAGLVVRYNWIESGNRQLDLVDAEDTGVLVSHPSYSTTYVYGNILIEPDGAGNSQIIHYGGDSGTLADYRKGNLFFYNNTVISTRSGNTTLVRLSTADETMHAFNNIIYNTAAGANMALMNDEGTLNIENNWLQTGWTDSHSAMTGTINDLGDNIDGADPMFTDFAGQDFTLLDGSDCIDAGDEISAAHLPDHDVANEYLKHTQDTVRYSVGPMDMGAFENTTELSLAEMAPGQFSLYPNPASDELHIDGLEGDELFSIRSVDGKQVAENLTIDQLDIRNLKAGLYILNIRNDEGESTIRFVKK